MRRLTVLGAIRKLIKKVGSERADNILTGILMVNKDPNSVLNELKRVLEET